MYTPFAKLLCTAALASTALAQNLISIISPKPDTTFQAGVHITITLKESAVSSQLDEVALVIKAISGPFDGSHLGSGSGVQGKFEAQWTDDGGNKYANYSIDAPNSFDGLGSINVAHYFLFGEYGDSTLEYTSVDMTIKGSGG